MRLREVSGEKRVYEFRERLTVVVLMETIYVNTRGEALSIAKSRMRSLSTDLSKEGTYTWVRCRGNRQQKQVVCHMVQATKTG